MNRRQWILTAAIGCSTFVIGLAIGVVGRKAPPAPAHSYQSLGGVGMNRFVLDSRTGEAYVISSSGVYRMGNVNTPIEAKTGVAR